jgi:hypothetical protein
MAETETGGCDIIVIVLKANGKLFQYVFHA